MDNTSEKSSRVAAPATCPPSSTPDGVPKNAESSSAATLAASTKLDSQLNLKVQEAGSSNADLQDDDIPSRVNPEFLLLENSTLERGPEHVDHLLSAFLHLNDSRISAHTQAELLITLIYCIAIESGFATIVEFEKCFAAASHATIGHSHSYHSKNVRKLSQCYPTIFSDANKMLYTLHLRQILIAADLQLVQCRLTCIVSGDFLIVTLTPDTVTGARGGSACLSIGRYVLSSVAKGKPLYHRLRKLKELSLLMREKLFVPVRNQQWSFLEEMSSPYPSLIGLPAELYVELFKYLTKSNMSMLAGVCRLMRLHCCTNKNRFKGK